MEILTIIAILIGPIISVQIQKYLERTRTDLNRKLDVFKTLMATRGSSLSYQHVEALNRIDLEFSNNKKYVKIIEAWKEYFDNLSKHDQTKEELVVWGARNEELLANLLYEMALPLHYKFDKVLIKRNIYSPVGHANIELENNIIRKGLMNLMKGEIAFPVQVIIPEETLVNISKQSELQQLLIDQYKAGIPTKVQIVK